MTIARTVLTAFGATLLFAGTATSAPVTFRGPLPLQVVPVDVVNCHATNYGTGSVDVNVEILTNTGQVLASSGLTPIAPYEIAVVSHTFQLPPVDLAVHCRVTGLSPKKGSVTMSAVDVAAEGNSGSVIHWTLE